MSYSRLKSNIVFKILFFGVLSCSNKNPNSITFDASILETLESSNSRINRSSEVMLAELEEKTKDSATSRRANKWYAKAESVRTLCLAFQHFVSQLQLELSTRESQKPVENTTGFTNDFIEEFVSKLSTIDSEMTSNLKEHFVIIPKSSNLDNLMSHEWVMRKFLNWSLTEKILVLGLIKSNTQIVENEMIAYCYNKVPDYIYCGFDFYMPICHQNSSRLRPGEVLEINAGIGAFSKAALPKISINGNSQQLNPEGVAVYRFKVSSKAGNYNIPVVIEFIDRDGYQKKMAKQITYEVVNN